MIRVANGEANLTGHDPQELVGALTKVLSQSELLGHLSSTELTHELSTALRGSIRLSEMRSAVAELRSNLTRERRLNRLTRPGAKSTAGPLAAPTWSGMRLGALPPVTISI